GGLQFGLEAEGDEPGRVGGVGGRDGVAGRGRTCLGLAPLGMLGHGRGSLLRTVGTTRWAVGTTRWAVGTSGGGWRTAGRTAPARPGEPTAAPPAGAGRERMGTGRRLMRPPSGPPPCPQRRAVPCRR